MAHTPSHRAVLPKKRVRRTQERAEITRGKLIDAGKELFSKQGFDGVSAREIEVTAGVKRNLLAYHFSDKETLWKAVVDAIYGVMKSEFDQRLAVLKEMSSSERLGFIVRFYVYFHARHPELSRLMSQEATQNSWRMLYMIDNHIRPATAAMEKLVKETRGLDREAFVHWYYIMISATATIFSFASECQALFHVDPCEESMVEAHADMLVSMLINTSD
ncbi:TetR/AcrR family transcriptional regulator [Candidatus Marimicrobium litorale]|uniref:TetR/AcrR family transcriptional regulator n=1 Tax=Candidatus Marimicrobium litorale TaxID=2518991 RepID=A0ABT3T8T5_9GAMM|nr:TetR/AcrR family transcriptional regulator [Candidatus Marimicrobium litorale]MCX2978585.1 TetR/AcrR family transcriptional regulator [Candidatus Marimicrobium litorale]